MLHSPSPDVLFNERGGKKRAGGQKVGLNSERESVSHSA